MLDLRNLRTNNLGKLLPILEEHDRRHSADTEFLSDLRHCVDVDLEELRLGVGLAEFFDLRSDGLAGAAPCGPAIEDDCAL